MLRTLAILVLALGSAAITAGSVGYFDADEFAPFVIEKLPLESQDRYLAFLQTHVVSAAWSLPACLLLISKTLLRKAPRWHRYLGRTTGAVVMLGLVPSGCYLAWFAKGGVAGTIGFLLSGGIVAVATLQGVRAARSRNYGSHRRLTMHVLAQLSVAVTSRAMLFALDAVDADPERAYLASLWIPVVGTAIWVEWSAGRAFRSKSLWRSHEETSALRHSLRQFRRVGESAGS